MQTPTTISPDDIQSDNVEAVRRRYKKATSTAHSFMKELGGMQIAVLPSLLEPTIKLWRNIAAARYARVALSDMALLPALLAPTAPSTLWFIMAQPDTGVTWIDGPPANVEIDLAKFNAFFGRLESRMVPSLTNLELLEQHFVEVRRHMLNLHNSVLDALQDLLRLG